MKSMVHVRGLLLAFVAVAAAGCAVQTEPASAVPQDDTVTRAAAVVAPAPPPPVALPFAPAAVAALPGPYCMAGCDDGVAADPLLCIQPISFGICLGFNASVAQNVSTISYYPRPAGGCPALGGQACSGFMPVGGVAVAKLGTIPRPITECGGPGDLCCNAARAGASCMAGLNCVADAAGAQWCQAPNLIVSAGSGGTGVAPATEGAEGL